jgi:hypothetical protein
MAKATRVYSTPPTNMSVRRRDLASDHVLLEGSILDVFHMSEIVANAMSDADGMANLQQLEGLVFSVYHLCDMVRDLRREYYDGTALFCDNDTIEHAARELDRAGKAVQS